MNKRFFSLPASSIAFFAMTSINAQVPLKSIVEHFTNTNCSVCASRNPGFYGNLNNYPNVNYISVHPSSPYASCLLSQQNTTDNNARTNFYSIFGSTPRIVINGQAISAAANYTSSTLFSSLSTLMSDYSIRVESSRFNDSISNNVIIKKHSNTAMLSSADLFIGAIEDTVTYTGGNGEAKHYNVLRKTITAPASITLPVNIGDSITLSSLLLKNTIWNWNRMKIVAILSNSSNKQIIQSEIKTPSIGITTPLSIENVGTENTSNEEEIKLDVYPNPATDVLHIKSALKEDLSAYLISSFGQIYPINIKKNEAVTLTNLPKGLYFLKAQSPYSKYAQKIVIQ
jgi:hypothetical protein